MERRQACAGGQRGTARPAALRTWETTACPCLPAPQTASTAKVRLYLIGLVKQAALTATGRVGTLGTRAAAVHHT